MKDEDEKELLKLLKDFYLSKEFTPADAAVFHLSEAINLLIFIELPDESFKEIMKKSEDIFFRMKPEQILKRQQYESR